MDWLLKILYKHNMKLVINQIIVGRYWDPARPEEGRILNHHGKQLLSKTWDNLNRYLPEANLKSLPTFGNRHNVFLAVLTTAGFNALLSMGVQKENAMNLISDAGWKLYTKLVSIPHFLATLITKNHQKRLNMILKMMILFPFNGPGRPGYEVKYWAEENHFRTDWTFCPPLEFVKNFVKNHGDNGELEMFQRSWCNYDWALTYAMVDNSKNYGHYERPHTLSKGDNVCDMYWYGNPK